MTKSYEDLLIPSKSSSKGQKIRSKNNKKDKRINNKHPKISPFSCSLDFRSESIKVLRSLDTWNVNSERRASDCQGIPNSILAEVNFVFDKFVLLSPRKVFNAKVGYVVFSTENSSEHLWMTLTFIESENIKLAVENYCLLRTHQKNWFYN